MVGRESQKINGKNHPGGASKGLKAGLFCATICPFIMTLRSTHMLHRKTILIIALTLGLNACSTVDGVFADIDQMFKKGSTSGQASDITYIDPLPDGSLPADGKQYAIAPTSQMDLSYNRVASDMSNSSVELFSLDAPGQSVAPLAYSTASRRSAGTGNYGVDGVPSSTDNSVTIFPFTNDMYTPGIKAGIPAFRSAPRGGGGYQYAGGLTPMPAHPATQIEDLPMYIGSPNTIYFNHGSAALSAVARDVLASVAKMEGNRVIVEAHASQRAQVTDPALRAEVNLKMSMKRAMAVTKALIAQGVPEHMIKTTALGDTKPAVAEVDREAEALNRRVEILSRP
jgi:outer membrane protein OmpA-like peptidoglycan-associated protein